MTIVSGKPGDDVRPGTSRRPKNEAHVFLAIGGELGCYSARVPELPAILITGQSLAELTARDREAIRLYWESAYADLSPTSTLREIEVELSA